MELHDALRTRRTIHRFRPGSVSDAILERAMAAATFAPNHKLTWPFRFVVAGPEARAALVRASVRLKALKRGTPPDAALEAKVSAELLTPDRMVAVVQVLSADPGRREEDYAACACATYALLLSLHADGVGAKWGTGGTTRDAEALDALGIDPAKERVVAFVWIGVPDAVPAVPQRPERSALVRTTR